MVHRRDGGADLKSAATPLQQVSLRPLRQEDADGSGVDVCALWFIDSIIDWFIGSMARRLSSLEILLSTVTSLLLLCCVTLIVLSALSFKPRGDRSFNKLTGWLLRCYWSACGCCHWCRCCWASGAEWPVDHHRGGRFLWWALQLQQSLV